LNNGERASEISMADRERLQFRERESTVQERVMQMQMGWLSIPDKKKIDRNSRLWRGGGPVWCRLVSAFLFFLHQFTIHFSIIFAFAL